MKDIDGNVLQYTTATVTRPNGHTLDAQAWKAYTYNEEGEKQLLYTQYASTETGEDGKTTVVWKTTGADGNEVKTWKTVDAEGNVVEVENDGSLRLYSFEIGNTSPLGVYATGRVDVKASGKDVYIAGRYADNAANTSGAENESGGGESASKDYSPINVGQITTAYQKVKTDENGNAVTDVEGNEVTEEARSNVRLYTQAGIYNADTAEGETINARIVGENLIAYGGEADIGKKDDMLTVDLSGDLLGAYAGDADDKCGNVYIRNTRTDDELRVGAVFAGDTICLESEKGFLRTTNDKYEGDAYLNAGKLVYLNATKTTTTVQKDEQGNDVTDDNGNPVTVTVTEYTGNIGTLADPIRILNNTGTPDNYGGDSANDGMLINLTGDNAYIRGVSGSWDMGDGTTMRLGLIDVKTDFVATSDSHIEAGAVRLGEGDEEGINGEITTREGNVKLDAEKNIVLNGPVTAGTVVKEENPENQEIFSYTGGNTINLISADGYIKQNGTGGLTAKKVDVVSGAGIKLTNDDNTFREFTAVGVEKNKTDEEGNVVYDNENNAVKEIAIDGSVDVRAHAGNTPATTGVGLDGNPVGSPGSALVAGFTESTTIYGDVALKNLDEGSLTVETKIVTKAGANGEAGDISFEQAGDIITLGDLDAANDINVNSDSGNIFLRNDIKAGQDITVSTGDDGVILLNDVANADNNVYAGRNVTLTSENTGLGVGGNVRAETGTVSATTTKGIINFVGDVYAGEDITAVIKEGDADSVIRYDGTTLAENNVVATANQGDIMYGSDVEAHGSVIAVTGKGDVGYNANVRAGDSVTAHTDEGDILVRDNIVTEQGNVTLTTADGFVIVGEPEQPVGEVLKGMIVANGDVSIATQTGSVAVQSEIISQNGNVSIEVVDANEGWPEYLANEIPHMPADTPGGIYVGLYNMGEAISAKQDINLLVKDGVITINGTTKTEEGDISVHAIDKETDQNIVITQNGKLDSGRDLTLHTYNGGIEVTDDTHAERNLYVIVDNKGSVQFNENVDVTGAVTAEVKDGDIAIGKTVNAGKEIDLSTGSGNITVGEDVTAGTTVNLTSGKGSITIGDKDADAGSVKANGNVNLTVTKGNIDIVKTVVSEDGNVTAKADRGNILIGSNGTDERTVYAKGDIDMSVTDGIIKVQGKTETADGDISMQAHNEHDDQNIVIEQDGKLDSGRDLTLHVYNGDIKVTDDTLAERDLKVIIDNKGSVQFNKNVDVSGAVSAEVKDGDITIGKTINAGKEIDMKTGTGDITVGGDVTSGSTVNLTSGKGDITVGSGTSGNVKGAGDVTLKTGTGDVTINKTVTSTEGSIDIATGKGKIHIGDNGPNVKTVTAKKDVSLATENGKIEVYGKTSTAKGDITLKAANPKYKSGEDGQNIIIDHNGRIDSGRDATLIAKNGDLHVTDRVKAKRDVNAITEKKGDIFLDEDLTVKGSLTMQTDTGDIYADRYAKAGNRIVASTGKGDITVGTADAKYVSLTSGGKNSHTTAKTIRTEANGNSKGTGKEDIKLGGSYVTANSIVNKSKGSTPLAISTLGSSKDKAMKDFNIGTRNADGSYAGGIQSGSGAVMQQLWTDNAMVYMAGKMNLHVSKAVVNNKLHAANDNISLAVFGRTPTHDGEQVVYWNDRNQNNPGALQNRWFNRAYADPKWMYLDLFGNGDIGSKYGVLVDANYHRRLYGDSVSVADTMRIRVERDDEVRDVVYYDRGGLIHVDANVLPADEENGGITAD